MDWFSSFFNCFSPSAGDVGTERVKSVWRQDKRWAYFHSKVIRRSSTVVVGRSVLLLGSSHAASLFLLSAAFLLINLSACPPPLSSLHHVVWCQSQVQLTQQQRPLRPDRSGQRSTWCFSACASGPASALVSHFSEWKQKISTSAFRSWVFAHRSRGNILALWRAEICRLEVRWALCLDRGCWTGPESFSRKGKDIEFT